MTNLDTTLTMREILDAMRPAWNLANRTDDSGKFLRPDYREALVHVWEDIVVASSRKDRGEELHLNLNVAMTKSESKMIGGGQRDD